ncbi:hypothetical protein IFR05_004343 [Cadophora sp. M221]|nr:hypothetical protein IFR05_004343 [Cadophora sp. M221]
MSKQDPLVTNLLHLSDAVDFMSASSNESQDIPYDDFEGVLASDGSPHRRRIQHSRTYFRSNDLSTGLKLGEMQSRALSFQAFELVGTAEHYSKTFVSSNKSPEAEFNTVVTEECGLVHTEGDEDWWAPSGKSFYSPMDMDAFYKESFKSEAVVEYDAYDLCVVQTRDALESYTTVGERNRDNSRNTEVSGMDYPTGGKPEDELGDVLDVTTVTTLSGLEISAFLDDPDSVGRRLLGSASTRTVYDLFAYGDSATSTTPQPAFTASIARTVHISDPSYDDQADLVINFSFSDGFGRAIHFKIQAAPGPVPKRDERGKSKLGQDGMPEMDEDLSFQRWIGSGWSVFDNKGNVVRHFEPFFTYQHNFEYNLRVGASTTTFYDPISRPIETLSADNSWSKVDFDPWKSVIWDASDTVLIDNPEQDTELGYHFPKLEEALIQTWYQKRIRGDLGPEEKKAAEKSAAYAATPNTSYLNPSGQVIFSLHPVVAKYSNAMGNPTSPAEFQSMTAHLNIQDRQTSVKDSKGRLCAKTVYNVAGNATYQSTMDGGERWTLYSLMGEPVYRWNSRGFRFATKYDELRRTVAERLVDETLQETTILVREFGESRDNAERDNLRRKLVSVCDQAGKVITERYDFKGQLLETTRILAKSYNTQLDWSTGVDLEGLDYTFSSLSKQDALGRPTQLTQFNGSKVFLKYDSGGKLHKIDGTLENSTEIVNFVENIEYNAKGLKTHTTYGNGVVKEFRYDPLTQRLRDVTASRGSMNLQELHYVYDAQGNIVHIRDSAQETVFFRNEVVSGDSEYTYDSVGRLIEATGREHLGQLGNDSAPSSAQRPYHDFRTRFVAGNDPSALGRYLERYTYDSVNNILSMQHDGTPEMSSMTRKYNYADIDHNNKLTSTVVGNQIEEYKYEGLAGLHGNMTSMPHLSRLQWNFMDQIQSTAKTRVNNGGTPENTWYHYEVAGQRVRKVTESQTVTGQVPRRLKERIYLGACEVYREYDNTGSNITLECCTLNVTDGSDQVARVDIRTKGTEQGVPAYITRYQITNHLQSVSMELDETGNIASYEEYTPFGWTSYSAVESSLEVPKIRRWNNKEPDDETGLYHCGARYYAPWLGRWTSTDPSRLADG